MSFQVEAVGTQDTARVTCRPDAVCASRSLLALLGFSFLRVTQRKPPNVS
jgi:hypothetical protein